MYSKTAIETYRALLSHAENEVAEHVKHANAVTREARVALNKLLPNLPTTGGRLQGIKQLVGQRNMGHLGRRGQELQADAVTALSLPQVQAAYGPRLKSMTADAFGGPRREIQDFRRAQRPSGGASQSAELEQKLYEFHNKQGAAENEVAEHMKTAAGLPRGTNMVSKIHAAGIGTARAAEQGAERAAPRVVRHFGNEFDAERAARAAQVPTVPNEKQPGWLSRAKDYVFGSDKSLIKQEGVTGGPATAKANAQGERLRARQAAERPAAGAGGLTPYHYAGGAVGLGAVGAGGYGLGSYLQSEEDKTQRNLAFGAGAATGVALPSMLRGLTNTVNNYSGY